MVTRWHTWFDSTFFIPSSGRPNRFIYFATRFRIDPLLFDYCCFSIVNIPVNRRVQPGESNPKLYPYPVQPFFQCCSDAVILLGCVLGAVSAQSTGYSALFDDFSILTLNFWSRALVRMAAVTIQLGVMKPALKVSPSSTHIIWAICVPVRPSFESDQLKLTDLNRYKYKSQNFAEDGLLDGLLENILGDFKTNLDWDL